MSKEEIGYMVVGTHNTKETGDWLKDVSYYNVRFCYTMEEAMERIRSIKNGTYKILDVDPSDEFIIRESWGVSKYLL